MSLKWKKTTAAKHLADYLRTELVRGRWSRRMPGVIRLANELGASRNTVEAALRELDGLGILIPQGQGRGRLIDLEGAELPMAKLRVGLFAYEAPDLKTNFMLELRHQLADLGHVVQIPDKSLLALGMNVARVARVAEACPVDAWLVLGGSRDILAWFAEKNMPVFAIFGRYEGLQIAGTKPDKTMAMTKAVRELIGLGHRRIVLMTRRMRRLPNPGAFEQTFLDTLEAGGIEPGNYHLPDWPETVAGFHDRLDRLFKFSPPSALILDEVAFFVAAMDFCASRGLRVPQDLSLMCLDSSPDFHWCRPAISHIAWDSAQVVRRVLRWVEKIGKRKTDQRQTYTKAEFIKGGTIGAAKMSS